MKPDSRKQQALLHVQNKLGYTFKQPALLERALTHRSFSSRNNERFEFVGDAILNYTVARMLFDAFPDLPEGRLSRMRANLVNQDVLAEIAAALNIGDALFLGQGELKSGGFRRPSILADAVEATFAAISFDADFATAEHTVRRLFAVRVEKAESEHQGKDPKTLLQEALQARRFALPKYRIEQQTGEGNEAEFTVACDLGELGCITLAKANSRRQAEQYAAKEAFAWLEQKHPLKVKKK
ncbi:MULTISPECIES: ribonuclease III [unclassified Neisseria]|uniref:ribonuclease III n=1 Tax=unclassified Neisseria TaxID=2623750 RepID=UPI0026656D09|nr:MULTISPECIES: ribonuclease III [unclassified Neisseria]MDO1509276.1 ribonuclease III [Neisseria sp. MVDL19-042950]MDO1515445.1 ribonuclease III [Neisseria sp. MVDL18-041461]MDO1562805.1 ribonuclease III [Neisseria sp. MVDL20-010259]